VGWFDFARPAQEGRGLGEARGSREVRKKQLVLGEDLESTKRNLRSVLSPKSAQTEGSERKDQNTLEVSSR
jgi:hypothetical protein